MQCTKSEAINELIKVQRNLINKAFSNNSIELVFKADVINNSKLNLQEYEDLLKFSSNLILTRYTNEDGQSKEYRHFGPLQIQLEAKVWAMALNEPQKWSEAIKYIAYDKLHASGQTPAGIFFLDSFFHEGIYGQWDLVAMELKTGMVEEIYFVENISSSKDLLEEIGYKEIDNKIAIEKIFSKNASLLKEAMVKPN